MYYTKYNFYGYLYYTKYGNPSMEIRISSRCLCFKLSGLKLTDEKETHPVNMLQWVQR